MAELVLVTWEDTINIAAWQTPADVAEWAGEGGWICQNIGWLIHQDDNCVVIAGRRCRDEQHHVGLAERIPRRAILEMNTIPDPDMKQPQPKPGLSCNIGAEGTSEPQESQATSYARGCQDGFAHARGEVEHLLRKLSNEPVPASSRNRTSDDERDLHT